MKRMSKRILALAAVLLLVAAMAAPALAAGDITPVTGTQIVYRSTKSGVGEVEIELASGTKNFTIKRSDVKVTAGGTGAKLVSFRKNSWSNESLYESDYSASGKWTSDQHGNARCSYSATLRVSAAGTATVSYKIGSKTYKTTIKVLNYVNPVKSITLTGVNGGKTFASLTKSAVYPSKSLTLKSNPKTSALKITPASGWKITEVYFNDETSGVSRSI